MRPVVNVQCQCMFLGSYKNYYRTSLRETVLYLLPRLYKTSQKKKKRKKVLQSTQLEISQIRTSTWPSHSGTVNKWCHYYANVFFRPSKISVILCVWQRTTFLQYVHYNEEYIGVRVNIDRYTYNKRNYWIVKNQLFSVFRAKWPITKAD